MVLPTNPKSNDWDRAGAGASAAKVGISITAVGVNLDSVAGEVAGVDPAADSFDTVAKAATLLVGKSTVLAAAKKEVLGKTTNVVGVELASVADTARSACLPAETSVIRPEVLLIPEALDSLTAAREGEPVPKPANKPRKHAEPTMSGNLTLACIQSPLN
jgi:hypothetical protein